MEDLRYCEEFDSLMQTYRHTPITEQQDVLAAFEAVVVFIEKRIGDLNGRQQGTI